MDEGRHQVKPVLDALDLHLIAIGLMYLPRNALDAVATRHGLERASVNNRLQMLDNRINGLRSDI